MIGLVDAILERSPPVVVAVAGGVGVGKTTLAGELVDLVVERGFSATVVTTDNFLLPNDVLARAALTMKKGFPESYAVSALVDAITELRHGRACAIPVYDHQLYDVTDAMQEVAASDVVIVEGVNALQQPIRDIVDVAVYIDAEEDDAAAWFQARFETLCDQGVGFYKPLASMTREQQRAIADSAWTSINLVNLREHIAPTRDHADIVLLKARDHSVVSITSDASAAPRARAVDPS